MIISFQHPENTEIYCSYAVPADKLLFAFTAPLGLVNPVVCIMQVRLLGVDVVKVSFISFSKN